MALGGPIAQLEHPDGALDAIVAALGYLPPPPDI